jgi:hypothetical protein
LITLALFFRTFAPNSPVRFFDDDKKFAEFKKADINYPNYPSPENWTNKHYIALLNKMLTDDGPKWQLLEMPFQDLIYNF